MCKRTSWMRLSAQARNPYSRSWLWIPGSLASLAPRNDGEKISAAPFPTKAGLHPRLGQAVNRARSAQRVDQEARHRHLTDAAGHRRDRAGDIQSLLKGDVADQASLAVGSRQPVDADIDHRGARLYPVAAHHLRLA